jgi:hypothetical protein
VNGSRNGSVEMDSGRTPGGVGLGEVGHSQKYYRTGRRAGADYQSTCPRAYAGSAEIGRFRRRLASLAGQVCDNNGSNFSSIALAE